MLSAKWQFCLDYKALATAAVAQNQPAVHFNNGVLCEVKLTVASTVYDTLHLSFASMENVYQGMDK